MIDKKNPPACRGRGEEKVELLTDIITTSSRKNQVKEGKSGNLSEILSRLESKIVKSDEEVDAWERKLASLSNVTRSVIRDYERHLEAVVEEPQQLPLGILPTDFCRTTFCRPIRRKDMRPADSINKEIFESSWGRIEYLGPDCGVAEEDTLIAIMGRWVKNGFKGFECQYSDLLDDLGYKRQKNGKHSTRNIKILKQMLLRLSRATFTCIFFKEKGKTAGFVTHAISHNWDDERGVLKINIDEWFAGTIGRGFITGINLEERRSIKGDIAKCLHRFLSSHSQSHGVINVFLLAQVIGVNTNQPAKKIRQNLKLAVRELKRIGFLAGKTRFRSDVLYWYRTHKVLGGPKVVSLVSEKKSR